MSLGRKVPRAAWLRSEDHEKWAAAMVLCQSGAAMCGADGFCHYGGDCFRDQPAFDELRTAMRAMKVARRRLHLLGYSDDQINKSLKETKDDERDWH